MKARKRTEDDRKTICMLSRQQEVHACMIADRLEDESFEALGRLALGREQDHD